MKKQLAQVLIWLIVLGNIVFPQTKSELVDQSYEEQQKVYLLNKGILFARVAPFMVGKKVMQATVPDLSEVLAENYVRIDFRGRLFTKEQELLRHKEAATNPAHAMQIVDSEVNVWESVAVAKDTYKVENPYDTDLYPTGAYRVTNIYTKIKGKWYLSLTQWTTLAD